MQIEYNKGFKKNNKDLEFYQRNKKNAVKLKINKKCMNK